MQNRLEQNLDQKNDKSEFNLCEDDKKHIETTATKTGTTIVGLRFNKGIVIAADTRSTAGPIVADKNCQKIHKLHEKIYACGAGTAADADRVTRMVSKYLNIFEKKYEREPRVSHCVRFLRNYLFSRNGYISAALVVGGVDETGAHLFSLSPHGYFNREDYTAMGSGYYAAMGILETRFVPDMEQEAAIELACDAVKAGILNDLYSGSNIDVCIINTFDELAPVDMRRNYKIISARENVEKLEKYPTASIKITKEEILKKLEMNDE